MNSKIHRIPCIEVCQRRISEMENFSLWDDDIVGRAVQTKNIKNSLRYFKSRLRYYEKKLGEME